MIHNATHFNGQAMRVVYSSERHGRRLIAWINSLATIASSVLSDMAALSTFISESISTSKHRSLSSCCKCGGSRRDEGFSQQGPHHSSLSASSPCARPGFRHRRCSAFFIIDYISNGTLCQRHLKGTHLLFEIAVNHTKQVSDALQYAHGDLKKRTTDGGCYPRCASLDVQKKHVRVCVMTPDDYSKPRQEPRNYVTRTKDVLQRRDLL